MAGILGKKIGMTNIFDEAGAFVPVTLIEAGPCFILGRKTREDSDYSAVVLGYEEKKPSKTKQPEKKYFSKIKVTPKKTIREIRLEGPPELKVGDQIGAGVFKSGDYVDVSGISKGKGFQGGMKRWHWSGGEAGHGSMFHRAPGSIGASSFPSRVHKGKTMPGHMGASKNTVQNLKVMIVEEDRNIIALKGSVPGHRGTILLVRHAKKRQQKQEQKKDK